MQENIWVQIFWVACVILAADAGEAAGLRVIELSADVQQQFADLAPHLAGVANPVDLGADAPPETIGRRLSGVGRLC